MLQHTLGVFAFYLFFVMNLSAQTHEMPIYTITSSQEAQPGSEAVNAMNPYLSRVYHSRWGQSGIPDTLRVYFSDRVRSISEIVYVPRTTGLNGVWTEVQISYATRDQPDVFNPLPESAHSWPASNDPQSIVLANPLEKPAVIRFEVSEGFGDYSSCAALQFFSEEEAVAADGRTCPLNMGDVLSEQESDIKASIQAQGSFASGFQPGSDIDRSFDGDVNTIYHSPWGGETVFPVILNYRFDGQTDLDYLKYYPRIFGSNGFFGQVAISYNTAESGPGSDFTPLMTYDFAQSGLATRVDLPERIRPLNIQIEVFDGRGDFASCAEMEFYTAQSSENGETPYSNIFTDELYTALQAGIGQMEIDTMRDDFFRSLAQCLLGENHALRYRHQSYEVYTPPATIRKELKVGNYNAFENPTGIAFTAGDTAVLFAREIPASVPVYLRVRDFANEDDQQDRAYQLTNGKNVIVLEEAGLGYISYFDEDINRPNVEIHITGGAVNGYFDWQTSDSTDWMSLLDGEAYSKLDVRGQYTHLIYDKGALRFGSPFDGQRLIRTYDTIADHERMMMGMYKYPERQVKNTLLSRSGFSGGWYAGGLGIHLDLSWGVPSITDPERLGLWGIAHEFGHVNQIRPGVTWHGTVEVTTNVYSTWVTYHMNHQQKPYTRLESDVVAPDAQSAPIAGGRINGFLEATQIRKEALKGAENYDVFKVLVPFWQLQLYYQLAGAARNAPVLSLEDPTPDFDTVDYANYFGIVAETMRQSDLEGLTPGELQLHFVRSVCDAVQEDLTDFFINTGFLRPIDRVIDDYGERQFLITQAQIDETIDYIKSKNYKAPVSPVIHYMSAHSLHIFRDQLPLNGSPGEGVEITDASTLTIDMDYWPHAIAFETYDENGQLKQIAIAGSGDPDVKTTQLRADAQRDTVYAVGFDGQRIQVYPEVLSSAAPIIGPKSLQIFPNPLTAGERLDFFGLDDHLSYQMTVWSSSGGVVSSLEGYLTELQAALNRDLRGCAAGVYWIELRDGQQRYQALLVKQ